MLLVSDLHLMEVDKFEIVAHLFLLLNLSLGLEDGNLKRHIFLGQLYFFGMVLALVGQILRLESLYCPKISMKSRFSCDNNLLQNRRSISVIENAKSTSYSPKF